MRAWMLIGLFTAAPAFAQDAPEPPPADDSGVFQDGAFVIEGKVQKPEVVVVVSRDNLDKSFDIQLKESFLDLVVEAPRELVLGRERRDERHELKLLAAAHLDDAREHADGALHVVAGVLVLHVRGRDRAGRSAVAARCQWCGPDERTRGAGDCDAWRGQNFGAE